MGYLSYVSRVKKGLSNTKIDAAGLLRRAANEMDCGGLLLWEEIPEWQKDGNQFIETGYRYGNRQSQTPPPNCLLV